MADCWSSNNGGSTSIATAYNYVNTYSTWSSYVQNFGLKNAKVIQPIIFFKPNESHRYSV